MKISIKVHNIIDYLAATILIACPFIFEFENILPAKTIFLSLGGGLALYSALTNYPFSLLKAIPIETHMIMDVISGLILMGSPWLFGYDDELSTNLMALHLGLGASVIGLVFFTYPLDDELLAVNSPVSSIGKSYEEKHKRAS